MAVDNDINYLNYGSTFLMKPVLGKSVQPRYDAETAEAESFNAPDITASASSWKEDVDSFSVAKDASIGGSTEEDDALSYFAKLAEE